MQMTKKHIFDDSLARRDFLAVLIVTVNAFSWYFPLYVFFETALKNFMMDSTFLSAVFGVHYMAVIGFAIAGIILVKRFPNRNLFLSLWMATGIVISVVIVTIETGNTSHFWLVSFLLGVSLGLGFPSCLAYFGDICEGESKGWLGGIVFFTSGICMLLVGLLVSISAFIVSVLIFAAWRGIGLILFLLVRPEQAHKEGSMDVSYKSILGDKSFLLYLLPWAMFCLVNFLEIPITIFWGRALFEIDLAFIVPIVEFGIGGFSALIGGWFSDSVGRKRIIIFGFIMLGIGYAVLGLFPNTILSWYLYIIFDGVAWGIFSLMFYLVIWSELAGNRRKEKLYLIGILPFLLSSYIQIIFTPYAELVPVSAAFSLASFFLFVAVLPLLYAPETLPEKQIELRRLRSYMERAKKVRRGHQERSDKS